MRIYLMIDVDKIQHISLLLKDDAKTDIIDIIGRLQIGF